MLTRPEPFGRSDDWPRGDAVAADDVDDDRGVAIQESRGGEEKER
jgi:hypothetical protein